MSERKKLALERARARELDRKLQSKDRETALLREKLRQLEWENFIKQKERELEKELEKIRAVDCSVAKCVEEDAYLLEERRRDKTKGSSSRRRQSLDRRSVSPHSSGSRHKSRERTKYRGERRKDSESDKETHIEVYVKYKEKDLSDDENQNVDRLRKDKFSCSKKKTGRESSDIGKHKSSREKR
jgi:uncharacterized OsmC-like protein